PFAYSTLTGALVRGGRRGYVAARLLWPLHTGLVGVRMDSLDDYAKRCAAGVGPAYRDGKWPEMCACVKREVQAERRFLHRVRHVSIAGFALMLLAIVATCSLT